ncbi:MAG: allophanate hydrolase [Burkholderiales bacterium]|nr:allophanate hydrolase [Phycisphaerae bacterium]
MPALSETPTRIATLEQVVRHVDDCLKRCDEYTGQGVWIHRCSRTEIDEQIERISGLLIERRPLPLLGMTLAVKDNIDVAGLPTTAACPAFSYTPHASASVVQKLCDAGVIILGKTNLDQFATGLVGTRSPYGACENFYDHAYISGGSSSGSAVAVAAGMCDASLGTDTAGSGRVPAGFNNLVGVKPSRGLVSTTGVVPACRSLDCISIFARDCDTAAAVLHVAEGFDSTDIYSRARSEITTARGAEIGASFSFGVPAESDLEFFGNAEYEHLFDQALARLEAIHGRQNAIDFGPFKNAGQLLYDGPWVAERLAAIQEFYERLGEKMLPVTRAIIGGAEKLTAVDAFHGVYHLAALRRESRKQWNGIDVLVLPTAGTIYTIEQVDKEPIQLNRNLGLYTNFVNLLDLCALAIPAGFTSGGLPFGITLVAPAGNESALFKIAQRFATGFAGGFPANYSGGGTQ